MEGYCLKVTEFLTEGDERVLVMVAVLAEILKNTYHRLRS